jgi:formylglycine-generating enzyme
MRLRRRTFAILGAIAALGLAGAYVAWLAWQGYLFPVHYRCVIWTGETVEGYGLRLGPEAWRNEGKYTRYFESGKRHVDGCFRGGRPVGTWSTYNGREELVEREEFADDGHRTQITFYDGGVAVRSESEPESKPRAVEIALPPDEAPPAEAAGNKPDIPRRIEETTNSIGMRLVLVPSGSFVMGNVHTPEEEAKVMAPYHEFMQGLDSEYPCHRVEITRPFYLGAYHVTVGQFRRFVEASGYRTDAERGKGGSGHNAKTGMPAFGRQFTWRNTGFNQTDEHPAVNISWNDAVAFCRWLAEKEGNRYRLPTEAEWEYACRAGTTTRYSSGDDPEGLARVGNVADAALRFVYSEWRSTIRANDHYLFTSPVGRFRPNAFGLYDMHGNAFQWCADWWVGNYYATCPVGDPPGPAASDPLVHEGGDSRVERGGSWNHGPLHARSVHRGAGSPGVPSYDLGFRVAREL